MHFQKSVDTTSREEMIAFLSGHFRYDTMRAWNKCKSYALNVKVHRLGLSTEQCSKAYDILQVEGLWESLNECIHEFEQEHEGRFTICSNGRSSGYLVLLQSEYRLTGHQSYCRSCYQRNFKLCALNDNRCGRCGADGEKGRVNYQTPPKELVSHHAGIDEDADFDEWSLEQLQDRVKLVDGFDKACDQIRERFIDLLSEEIVEETFYVPQKRMVLKSA